MSLAPPVHTLADLLALYRRDFLPHKAPQTQYQEGLLYRWFAAELGSIPLANLTPLVLRTWRDSLTATYTPGTVRRYLTALSAVLTAGVDEYQWLARNPLKSKAMKPPAPPGRERCLDAEELARLLAACAASYQPLLPLAVRLALCTATRKNELLHRLWSDIDLARGVLQVPYSKNKTRRAIPLVPQAVTLLERHQETSTSRWVFPRHDGLKPVFIDYAWRKACAEAAIFDLHFHDLRHTSASFLAMSGASTEEIRQIVGHRTTRMTSLYIHLTEPYTRAALERMADRFLSGVLLASTLTTLGLALLVAG